MSALRHIINVNYFQQKDRLSRTTPKSNENIKEFPRKIILNHDQLCRCPKNHHKITTNLIQLTQYT
jgi:hypothetical protein